MSLPDSMYDAKWQLKILTVSPSPNAMSAAMNAKGG